MRLMSTDTKTDAGAPGRDVVVAGGDGDYVARAADWMTLGALLRQGVRTPGARLRLAVDPAR